MLIDKTIKLKKDGIELVIDTNLDGHFSAKVFKDGVIKYQTMWYPYRDNLESFLDKKNERPGKKQGTTKRQRIMEV